MKLNSIILILMTFNVNAQMQMDLIPFTCNEKWGYSTNDKIEVIKAQFDTVYFFQNNFARIVINDNMGIVNIKGEIIIDPKYKYISDYDTTNNIFRVKPKTNSTREIYFNSKGLEIEKNTLISHYGCGSERTIPSSGLAHLYIYQMEDKYGFIEFICNKPFVDTCKIHHPAVYSDFHEIGENFIAVKLNDNWILYDYKRKKIKDLNIDEFEKDIYINKQFHVIRKNKKLGLIDNEGTEIFKCEFEDITHEKDEIFKVQRNNHKFYKAINKIEFICDN